MLSSSTSSLYCVAVDPPLPPVDNTSTTWRLQGNVMWAVSLEEALLMDATKNVGCRLQVSTLAQCHTESLKSNASTIVSDLWSTWKTCTGWWPSTCTAPSAVLPSNLGMTSCSTSWPLTSVPGTQLYFRESTPVMSLWSHFSGQEQLHGTNQQLAWSLFRRMAL